MGEFYGTFTMGYVPWEGGKSVVENSTKILGKNFCVVRDGLE